MKFKAKITYRAFAHAGLPEPMEIWITADGINSALSQLWERYQHAIPGHTGDLAELFNVRSMSVGDEIHLKVEGQTIVERFVAAPIGFDPLSEDEENEYIKPGSMWNPCSA